MAAAFEADAVELSVCGDWEDVQVEMGLLAARITPRANNFPFNADSVGARRGDNAQARPLGAKDEAPPQGRQSRAQAQPPQVATAATHERRRGVLSAPP